MSGIRAGDFREARQLGRLSCLKHMKENTKSLMSKVSEVLSLEES